MAAARKLTINDLGSSNFIIHVWKTCLGDDELPQMAHRLLPLILNDFIIAMKVRLFFFLI